jgi:MFS family permease
MLCWHRVLGPARFCTYPRRGALVTEVFAPLMLRSRAFRWLEGTALFSSTGVWMITLVSGYIMERLTTSPVLVTLAAAMGPLAGICAVVWLSGAVADSRDCRAVLLLAKILLISSVTFLVLMSSSHLLTPATLLIGLAGMGVAGGTLSPSWWTTVNRLVPPEIVPVAFSLDSFLWNISQVVGSALGAVFGATFASPQVDAGAADTSSPYA